ncbi:uncharacterized protein ColSpa_12028 [Colletotrichum spaethianum]|uniref:PD-(D/E)XK nuclease-like domain-containing protein n=1 Tax=Colletotrichum spaethianum TaxID=700344 RepID=A0AA37PGK8_9PEZI|nr:uncharacterized protein ColSpa_12028 [Colletotrichum spaethianum]GKT51847.1 hypothetical protein ColSpa_12028 [Colletotrichum spaethianum]
MVDYCMTINDAEIERAARNAVRLQRWPVDATPSSSSAATSSSAASSSNDGDVFSSPTKATRRRRLPHPPQSINQTEYGPLSMSPISVSIETKKNDGSEDMAKAQLSVWASAQILRLRQLIGSDEPLGITLPLVFVLGSTWQLLFAVERKDRIAFFGSLANNSALERN